MFAEWGDKRSKVIHLNTHRLVHVYIYTYTFNYRTRVPTHPLHTPCIPVNSCPLMNSNPCPQCAHACTLYLSLLLLPQPLDVVLGDLQQFLSLLCEGQGAGAGQGRARAHRAESTAKRRAGILPGKRLTHHQLAPLRQARKEREGRRGTVNEVVKCMLTIEKTTTSCHSLHCMYNCTYIHVQCRVLLPLMHRYALCVHTHCHSRLT